jgi:hypothetical protein
MTTTIINLKKDPLAPKISGWQVEASKTVGVGVFLQNQNSTKKTPLDFFIIVHFVFFEMIYFQNFSPPYHVVG